MKITKEYIVDTTDTIDVESARYIGDYTIRVFFSDGFNKAVDFSRFLESSQHPSIRKYLNETLLRDFKIIDGNVNWGDYDLIFPIENLYEGKI